MKLSLSLLAASASNANSTWQEQLRPVFKTILKITLRTLPALEKSFDFLMAKVFRPFKVH